MRYTPNYLCAQLKEGYVQHGFIVDDSCERVLAEQAGEIMCRARVFRGTQFFYTIATGIDDAMLDGKLRKISAIEKIVAGYEAKGKSLEPSRPGRRVA
ncbi:hypothetical protein J4211_01380 [Candidatus Woesearchaeota archaeon]|nr:hypothetical protein [uncultured archaeon]AQS33857.1 hypothetical protein [uncultured archaeon]MBS3124888.1 hypothetical protein [Candidatus Woesearchaeota archaeon]